MAAVQRKLVHKQFNSPMGLYSQENVKATLDRELKAFGADGIEIDEQITKPLNLANSAVLRAVEEEEQMKCGYKRVAWPPVSQERVIREYTPQPQSQTPPPQQHHLEPQQQPQQYQQQQQQQQAPSAAVASAPVQQQYRAQSYDHSQQAAPQPQPQHQPQQQYPYQGQPNYPGQYQAASPQPQHQQAPSWAQQQYQPPQQHAPQQYQSQYQYQPQQQQQQPPKAFSVEPQSNHFNSYSQQPPQDQADYQQQPQYQPLPQDYRGASPGIITLRKETPVSQTPVPVYTSQPAAVSYQGGCKLRGDLKWPPPEYKEAAHKENEERRQLALGPVCRPRRVNRQDYTSFFAKNSINSYYPSYKVPPGTQHMLF